MAVTEMQAQKARNAISGAIFLVQQVAKRLGRDEDVRQLTEAIHAMKEARQAISEGGA